MLEKGNKNYIIFIEMFLRMLTHRCDHNNSFEITANGYQVKKINKIRNYVLEEWMILSL